MEDFFFGGGWLDDLLKEQGASPAVVERVRECLQAMEQGGEAVWADEWSSIGELLHGGSIGEALEKAMQSLVRVVGNLENAAIKDMTSLESPLSPFLIRGNEIRKILYPIEELEDLVLSRDELDEVISLEMINAARRLLTSWGAAVWGQEPLELIPKLEADLQELRGCQTDFIEAENVYGLDFDEKEVEIADRLATLATRFALDLIDLHLLNARNPEVRIRFGLLWETVKQLDEGKNTPAAAFEALQVLEEALSLAGLAGGELLSRVDLLYERFGEAEELRRAVDHLVTVSRDGEGIVTTEEGRTYIRAMAEALSDLGLEVNQTVT
ncbi:MAG: hypothetical protein A2V52_03025 [Actinobacteria bacterium RBG_19FT_COMBO_54_7]|uniref:Uncharacterized protein n=1 Tax=Candidatus Solincola sediminis TaxID=1797199 RepID=A0A1F2WTA4_9ACTN|nr:MAG: hypothetical protein A2Y75_02280 [Candidatus Solincola sediminis]OFW60849.1 MAG: hypothetical protein A2W01_11685 [Candidatus Solincola sediminis]OFW67479.1 MAG: hypothetical protein A2V52_03025 [Actinobacteria bacterium RBG_19FT_COMBO_54_7]